MFNPPNPIKKFYYRCDKKFHLDDLEKLYETHDYYAIVLVSGKRTELYSYSINDTLFLKGFDTDLPNQHKTGGQSAPRFGRIRDEKISCYAKKIVDMMIQCYVKNGLFQCRGLVIAGPAEMKNLIQEQILFTQYFSTHLLKTITISEIVDNSIHHVVKLANDVLVPDDSEIIRRFEDKLNDAKEIDLLVFGTDTVLSLFKLGQLKEIIANNKSAYLDSIIGSKTKITIIKSVEFSSKYGELVGIKYYITE